MVPLKNETMMSFMSPQKLESSISKGTVEAADFCKQYALVQVLYWLLQLSAPKRDKATCNESVFPVEGGPTAIYLRTRSKSIYNGLVMEGHYPSTH